MKLPAKLVERTVDRIVKELVDKEILIVDDVSKFRHDVSEIILGAIKEEKELEEEAERLVEEHLHLVKDEDIGYRTAVRKVKERLAEERNIHLDPVERMNQVAHRIKKYIETEPSVDYREHPNKIRRRVFEILKDIVREEKEIDKEVRQRIKSYSRKIVEGTPEWRILYQRIYEDALKKRGLM